MESLAKLVVLIFAALMILSFGSGVLISSIMTNCLVYKLIVLAILQLIFHYFSPFPIQINLVFFIISLCGLFLTEYITKI